MKIKVNIKNKKFYALLLFGACLSGQTLYAAQSLEKDKHTIEANCPSTEKELIEQKLGIDNNFFDELSPHVEEKMDWFTAASSQNGLSRMQELYEEHKSIINKKTEQGRTALIIACDNLRVNNIKFLLWAGANMYVKDDNNETAIDAALNNLKEKNPILVAKVIKMVAYCKEVRKEQQFLGDEVSDIVEKKIEEIHTEYKNLIRVWAQNAEKEKQSLKEIIKIKDQKIQDRKHKADQKNKEIEEKYQKNFNEKTNILLVNYTNNIKEISALRKEIARLKTEIKNNEDK